MKAVYGKYRGADKSLAQTRKAKSSEACQGRARFQQHRDASCHQVFSLQGEASKEIHAVLTEILDCFQPGRAKDLSASLYSASIRNAARKDHPTAKSIA